MTYIDAGALKTYYEVTGAGDPVVVLHGGLCTVETLQPMAPGLSEHYQVYLPARRGPGRTPDVDGPITYGNMAVDTIAFLDAVGLRSVRLVGWGDCGNLATRVAPDRQ